MQLSQLSDLLWSPPGRSAQCVDRTRGHPRERSSQGVDRFPTKPYGSAVQGGAVGSAVDVLARVLCAHVQLPLAKLYGSIQHNEATRCDDTPHDDTEHHHGRRRYKYEHEYGDSYDDHNTYSHDYVCHVTPTRDDDDVDSHSHHVRYGAPTSCDDND